MGGNECQSNLYPWPTVPRKSYFNHMTKLECFHWTCVGVTTPRRAKICFFWADNDARDQTIHDAYHWLSFECSIYQSEYEPQDGALGLRDVNLLNLRSSSCGTDPMEKSSTHTVFLKHKEHPKTYYNLLII